MEPGELNAIFQSFQALLVAFFCFFECFFESFVGRVVLRASMNETPPGKQLNEAFRGDLPFQECLAQGSHIHV